MTASGESRRALNPVDRISEVQFGLIMALTFTGTLSAATAGQEDVRTMLIGALGCNVAWGIVDGVMYVLTSLAERGRGLTILHQVRKGGDPARARALIAGALPPLVASVMDEGSLERVRQGLAGLPELPARPRITLDDLRGAVAVFLLVCLSTLPVALPFVFAREPLVAMRVSNAVALAMLFLGGYALARYAGRPVIRGGLGMMAIGIVLVVATIMLGG